MAVSWRNNRFSLLTLHYVFFLIYSSLNKKSIQNTNRNNFKCTKFTLEGTKGRSRPKKRENVGILKKQGGGLPESHFHFLLFLTWETPQKKVQKCKINHRGVPHLGKIPTFSLFFFGNVPKCTYSVTFYL